MPILLKDNIATGDRQHTTAGSLALASARARDDATVAKRLRAAGAVILGKANLTEFANMLAVDMPSGYSSLGGQVRNPYAPALRDKRGIPVVQPGGSSSGSAVAVAAGLCAAAIGTETSGSLLSPATQNGLVTVKPTVGLISRAGILPISHSQDTAGPLTRTVRDAAILLNVMAARDPLDPATRLLKRPKDYTADLDKDGLKGARIGVPSDADDPLNDIYFGKLPKQAKAVMKKALKVLADCGAVLVRANIPTAGWIGGPGTTMNVLNRNPLSRRKGELATPSVVFVYELKRDLNLYLRDWATGTKIKTMADIVAFNRANAAKALRFGQDIFLAAEATRATCRSWNIARRGPWTCCTPARAGSMPTWRNTSSTPWCFPAWRDAPSRPRRAIPASRCRRASCAAASTARRRRTFRSASPSPAAPGARPRCCGWPTPTSRRPRRAGRRRDCRRFSCCVFARRRHDSQAGARPTQPLSWRAMNSLATSRALSVCGPGSATHSWTAFSNSR